MPQALLPFVPEGATEICGIFSVLREGDVMVYFAGAQPVFQHRVQDLASFRMFTAQMIERGDCRQCDIVRAFGVPRKSVQRASEKLRAEGIKGFFKKPRSRGGGVLTSEVLVEVQQQLNAGRHHREIGAELGIKSDTIRKAIEDGRLTRPQAADKAPASASRAGKAPKKRQ